MSSSDRCSAPGCSAPGCSATGLLSAGLLSDQGREVALGRMVCSGDRHDHAQRDGRDDQVDADQLTDSSVWMSRRANQVRRESWIACGHGRPFSGERKVTLRCTELPPGRKWANSTSVPFSSPSPSSHKAPTELTFGGAGGPGDAGGSMARRRVTAVSHVLRVPCQPTARLRRCTGNGQYAEPRPPQRPGLPLCWVRVVCWRSSVATRRGSSPMGNEQVGRYGQGCRGERVVIAGPAGEPRR